MNPDGTTTPALLGQIVRWNYDGSFMIISPGRPGGVSIFDQKGVSRPAVPPIPAGSTVGADGTVTTPDGKILDPNGQERPPKVILPGNVVLDPKGGNSPPPDEPVDPTKPEVELLQAPEGPQNVAPAQPGGPPPEQNGVPAAPVDGRPPRRPRRAPDRSRRDRRDRPDAHRLHRRRRGHGRVPGPGETGGARPGVRDGLSGRRDRGHDLGHR